MIQENIEIHDKYQFELKIGYKINEEDVDTLYNTEIYFFFPASLDIRRYTYSKKDFYNDLQTYIRFKSPVVILRNIASDSPESPVSKVRSSVEQLVARQDDSAAADYVRQIKMFCCIIKSALRDHVQFMAKQKRPQDRDALIEDFISLVPAIARKFREMRATINVPGLAGMLYSEYLFADEYLSLMIEESTFNLVNHIKSGQAEDSGRFTDRLYAIIRGEIGHRKESGYPSLPKESDDNEELIFRKSVLKKFASSVLYLKTTREREGQLLEQFLYGLAAGFAMMFATGIAFYSQIKYGSISATVFVVLIISYMFKDRIKELLRIYFSNKLKNFLYDHVINIFTAEKENIGSTREVFYFTHGRRVPLEILRIRNRDHFTEIENGWMGEKTAVYMQTVRLHSKRLIDLYKDYTMEGINNIMRFDVSKFLNKMDDPTKSLYLLDGNGHREISGKRVYHINLVMKYNSKQDTTYKRFRIVLNRDGIKRIEEVFSENMAK